jgi:hypothetical protein
LNHWKYVQRFLRTDPLNPGATLVVSSYRWFNGPSKEAAPPARRAIELHPPDVASLLHVIAASQIAEAGFRQEAIQILQGAVQNLDNPAERTLANFFSSALQGDRERALQHATEDLEHAIGNEFSARIAADGFALLGLGHEAVRWLRRAVELGYLHWPNMAKGAVFLQGIRETPGFQALLDEVEPRWAKLVEWEKSLSA